MNRGMTLVELLVALSLLGTLMLAMVSWTRLSVVVSEDVTTRARWESAADEVLQHIQDDILTGDFPASEDAPRVKVDAGKLALRARRLSGSGGGVLREYAFDPGKAQLAVREKDPTAGRAVSPQPILLLGSVASWSCQIDESGKHLEVELRSQAGVRRARRYAIP